MRLFSATRVLRSVLLVRMSVSSSFLFCVSDRLMTVDSVLCFWTHRVNKQRG